MRLLQAVLCTALIGSLGVLVPARQVGAAPVSTESLAQLAAADAARAKLLALVDRAEFARELARYGVDPTEARARVAALSDAEIANLSGRLDQIPAGEGFWETAVLVLLVGFVVLVLTDALGWTDVFPWVSPSR